MINCQNYSFHYPNQPDVLHELSFELERGSFTLLLGLNGSGKTTLINQLTPTLASHGNHECQILFEDQPIEEVAPEKIGFVMQNPDDQLVTDTVWHELAFGLENLGVETSEIRQRIAEVASFFGIQNWFDQDTNSLSGGQKQLLNLASVMVLNPELLILDEPTAQLDPIATDNLIQMLHKLHYELGLTIIITEHNIEKLLPYATRVLALEKGSLVVDDVTTKSLNQIWEKLPHLRGILPAVTQVTLTKDEKMANPPIQLAEGKKWLEEQKVVAKSFTDSGSRSGFEKPILTAERIWFRYTLEGIDQLKGLDFALYPGQLTALLGGNGSGKSTLLSLLAGLNTPYSGKVLVNETAVASIPAKERFQELISILPQDPTTLFVKNTIMADLVLTNKDEQLILTGAESLGITDLLDKNPLDLSGGQQQLVGLFKILLLKPKILFLDEPTKGLDQVAKQKVKEVLKALQAQNVAILMVTHDLDFAAEVADQVGLFFNGEITSLAPTHQFFGKNIFYTTQTNRLMQNYAPTAITVAEAVACLQK